MSEDTVRLSLIGQIFRRRWRLLAVFAVLGGLLGAGASLLLSPGYTTSTSVLLQGPREPDELLTEAQVAMSSVVLDRAAVALGSDLTGTELARSVSAKVADGNVIRITAAAPTPEQAQKLADQVADEYIRFSTQLVINTPDASVTTAREQREALKQQVADTNKRITDLHTSASQGLTVESVQVRTELEALRTSLTQAMAKLAESEAAASAAKMTVMGPAERPTSPGSPTLLQLAGAGALLGVLLGVLGHVVAARADKRLRGEPEIGAALGAPILASVDAPEPPPVQLPARFLPRLLARLRRLVWDDQPWNAPEAIVSADSASRVIRYRRLLSRLRGGPAGVQRLVLLVTKDDPTARRAAAQLAAIAGDRTDPAGAAASGPDGTVNGHLRVALRHTPPPDAGAVRVFEIDAGRPTIPDSDGASRALLLLSAGSRTGWELVAIAEACADAGQELIGAVVTHRSRPVKPTPPEPPAEAPARADALAGSR